VRLIAADPVVVVDGPTGGRSSDRPCTRAHIAEAVSFRRIAPERR
jgi:hypothetical protein